MIIFFTSLTKIPLINVMRFLERWLFILYFLSFFLLGGCEQTQDVQKQYEQQQVVVAGSQWYGHAPIWIGLERGIFKRHGFQVDWRFINSSADRIKVISSNEAQFSSIGMVAMLEAMVMPQDNRSFYWVGNQDNAPGFEGLVVQPGIKSFDDLRGKTIGLPFGSSVEITCRLLLRDNKLEAVLLKDSRIDPNDDHVKLVNLSVSDVPAVFRAGKVDAALIWEPGFSQLRAVKGATVLAMDTDTQMSKDFGTMTGPDVMIMSKAWADADMVRAQRFMQAYFEALGWLAGHPNEAADIIHRKYIQQDRHSIAKNLANITWYRAHDQRRIMADKEGLAGQTQRLIEYLISLKRFKNKPDVEKWIYLDVIPVG